MRSGRHIDSPGGFSLLEILVVVGLIGVVSAIAAPMMGNALGFFRLSGDARSTSNSIALAKMRASSVFGRVRLYADLSTNRFHLETFDKTTSTWVVEGGTTSLSQRVRFGFAPVGSAPPNTTAAINQAPMCKSNAVPPADIANTACIIFNSRGTPIDSNGAPSNLGALYLTDGSAVYGVTVSATGMARTWRTVASATPNWSPE
ncbi:MAG TPA: prepilin-type N-terminal cleavage/methylation domain-containing protein [Vicinamibacterales bacterium]|nr:prepilin-type N-terminal cleavage/methylation domain-containing protein [Vicinamibacterales bacterium]